MNTNDATRASAEALRHPFITSKPDLSAFSFEDLFSAFDALGTTSDVLNGLLCEPRFYRSKENEPTRAGILLDDILGDIYTLRDHIREAAILRPASNPAAMQRKAFFLIEEVADGLASPEFIVEHVTKVLAEPIGGEA